jgi:transposase
MMEKVVIKMPAPLSRDLRKRIVEARARGESITKIAQEKNVSESSINKLMALYRETGSYEARPLNNGRKPRLSPVQMEEVQQRIEQQPDISLAELIAELHLPVCESALCRTVNNKLGLRRKKNGIRSGTES